MTKANRKKPAAKPGRPAGTAQAARPAARRAANAYRRLAIALALSATAVVAVLVIALARDDDVGDTGAGGLLRTEAPWAPQTEGLRERVAAAAFPPVGDESFHVHALLSVFVDGEQVTVPANIGIDGRTGYHSPLHTHTPDGVIHFEADDPSPFTLGQVFSMWGVEFSADRLGAYTPTGDKRIHVYVDGNRIENPVGYELQEGDNVVVGYGPDGTFPTQPPDGALDAV